MKAFSRGLMAAVPKGATAFCIAAEQAPQQLCAPESLSVVAFTPFAPTASGVFAPSTFPA